jgi:hypothetical protein
MDYVLSFVFEFDEEVSSPPCIPSFRRFHAPISVVTAPATAGRACPVLMRAGPVASHSHSRRQTDSYYFAYSFPYTYSQVPRRDAPSTCSAQLAAISGADQQPCPPSPGSSRATSIRWRSQPAPRPPRPQHGWATAPLSALHSALTRRRAAGGRSTRALLSSAACCSVARCSTAESTRWSSGRISYLTAPRWPPGRGTLPRRRTPPRWRRSASPPLQARRGRLRAGGRPRALPQPAPAPAGARAEVAAPRGRGRRVAWCLFRHESTRASRRRPMSATVLVRPPRTRRGACRRRPAPRQDSSTS